MSDEELKTSASAEDQTSPEAEGVDPLLALQNELEEARQQVLYAQAETQNVRRRLEKDAQDARAYAATNFARDILSVADNLSRALEVIPEAMRADEAMKGLVVGLEATQRELTAVFERNGISRIAAMGLPLDPNQHQAMVEIPSDAEPGTIVQEMQAGYMIKDRLLRPALVGVAKKPD
ncbi:MAG: nucleotide exchange factor GrpE [Chakrabartia sp.]